MYVYMYVYVCRLEQFSEAKSGVWRPLQDLGRRSAQLPPLPDSERQLLAEAETLRKIGEVTHG